MKILNYLSNFSKRVVKSRTAQIFFLIQLVLIIIALMKRNWSLEDFHPNNESLLFNMLTAVNIPSILVASIICIPLMAIAKDLTNLYIFPVIMFMCWTIQWALIGYGIEKLIERFLNRNQIK